MAPFISILLLELEDLKDNMNRVQTELRRCVASLGVQSEETCAMLARLETVTNIARAVQNEEECSLPTQLNGLSANKKSMKNPKTAELKAFSKNLEESGDENYVNSDIDHLETDVQSTRPSLLRKHRKNNKDMKYISENTDTDGICPTNIATTTTSNTETQATRSVFPCPISCNPKESSPSSITSPLTSSSKSKMFVIHMLNRVEDICIKEGWIVEGCYSSRNWKEGCGVIHFYKLDVEEGMVELAVRRAFKTMGNRLKEISIAEFELTPARQDEDGSCTNMTNNSPTTELVEKNLTLSHSKTGAIIGKKGRNINYIMKECNVNIKVESLDFGKEKRTVKLKGEKACVKKALDMIEIIIETRKSVTDFEIGSHHNAKLFVEK